MEFGPAENEVEFDFGDIETARESEPDAQGWWGVCDHNRDYEQFVCTPVLSLANALN
jgi:hypothetical protein